MHPKNIYNTPPNFKQLAIDYPEFREHVKIDLSGRVLFDFQDQKALAALTKTLLLKDFNLNVEIPYNKLVPTLPLRLNYILWIEDLLQASNIDKNVLGIDIGTGASCVYPLLAAKRNWKMVGTEVLKDSADIARKNVERNSLSHMITILDVDNKSQILKGVINEEIQYTFCMCNPPFFSKLENPKNRNNRLPAKHAHTGSDCELKTDGGEIKFVNKLIDDSLLLPDNILIFTTMVGKKCNLKVLIKMLLDRGVKAMATTEFVQGRTFRWGLAWSFTALLPSQIKKKTEKAKPPVSYALPEGTVLQDAIDRIKELLILLKLSFEIEEVDPFTINITAFENTWSNQRRKRRAHLLESQSSTDKKIRTNAEEGSSSTCQLNEENTEEQGPKSCEAAGNEPILEFILKLINFENCVTIEATWLSGSAGKEGMHQVLQFMKNKWIAVEIKA